MGPPISLELLTMDTYTLIPNGTEITFLQGPNPVVVNAYLIQHDQTGQTIKWRGCSLEHYEEYTNGYKWEIFDPLLLRGSRKVKDWKKKELRRINQEKMISSTTHIYDILFDDCKPATSCAPNKAAAKTSIKYMNKENTMHYASANTIPTDQAQRDYLLSRLSDIRRAKEKEFWNHFKLDPVKGPRSMNELIQKIKDEDFTLHENISLDTKFYNMADLSYNIRWTKEKVDRDGYDKAMAELKKAEQAVKDQIVILDPKEGLKVLNDFQSKTFH